MTTGDPIRRFYAAFGDHDMAAMRACFTADARLWHCFDGIEQSLDEAAEAWAQLFVSTRTCGIDNIVRRDAADVVVQQHDFWMETGDGTRLAWHVCLLVRIEGERIARIDEYIDRAGRFTPDVANA